MFRLSFVNNNSVSNNEDHVKKPGGKYSGPFGATQMWNDMVKAFRDGMPLQRHRKSLKRFDNCFQASDAINWLQLHLRNSPDFGVMISRSQVELLLKKFYDAKVFEEVDRVRTGFSVGSKQLYRFCENENLLDFSCLIQPSISQPLQPLTSDKSIKSYFKPSSNKLFQSARKDAPLKTLNLTFPKPSSTNSRKKSSDKNSHSVAPDPENDPGMNSCQEVTAQQVPTPRGADAVLVDFLKSLNASIEHRDFSQLIHRIPCDVTNIVHNVSVINKNGIPTNIDKRDQLPLWFVTALKSLASGSLSEKLCNDTIDVVCDFVALQDKEPLISKDLLNVIMFSFNYFIEAHQRKSHHQPSPVEPSSNSSWKDIYRFRFNWKRSAPICPEAPVNKTYHSVLDSLDFIDSSPMLKSFNMIKRDAEVPASAGVQKNASISSPSKPLSFLGGVKQLKKNKKEKKLKNYSSLMFGEAENFGDLKVQPNLSTSTRDLSLPTTVDASLQRNGIRSEENLFTRSSKPLDYNFTRDSYETKKMIEILQHVLLVVPPKHRRMLMILIRLVAKSRDTCSSTCSTTPRVQKLLDVFQAFILVPFGSRCLEVATGRKVFHFMMEFYSEIFKIPQPILESVFRHKYEDHLVDNKENATYCASVSDSGDKLTDANFPRSILKKPKLEAVRF